VPKYSSCLQHSTDSYSAHNSAQSPLLRLPAEIRNEIYAYILTEPDATYHFDYRPYPYGECVSHGSSVKQPNRLALLRTCRQVFYEAAKLPFKFNTGYFADLGVLLCLASSSYNFECSAYESSAWLRDHLQSITIQIGQYEDSPNHVRRLEKSSYRFGLSNLAGLLPSVKTASISLATISPSDPWMSPNHRARLLHGRTETLNALREWIKRGNTDIIVVDEHGSAV